MRERWVRPPLVAQEPPPAWRAVWPYRVGVLLLAGLLVVLGVLAYRALSGATAQDPGVGASGAVLSPVRAPGPAGPPAAAR